MSTHRILMALIALAFATTATPAWAGRWLASVEAYDFEFLIVMQDGTFESCHATGIGSDGVEAREAAKRECKDEIKRGKKLSSSILKGKRPADSQPTHSAFESDT